MNACFDRSLRGAMRAAVLVATIVAAVPCIAVAAPVASVRYTLDAVGNRIEATTRDGSGDVVGRQTLRYDARDRLEQASDTTRNRVVEFDYDADGNQTRMTEGGSSIVRRYDARSRLLRAEPTVGAAAVHAYEPSGLRIESTVAGGARYRYDGTRLYAEVNGTNQSVRRYRGAQFPMLGLALLGMSDAGGTPAHRELLSDALGTPTVVQQGDGAIASRARYDAWGVLRAEMILDETLRARPNRIGYTGHVRDGADDYYANARYYDAEYGRFLSVDPAQGDPTRPLTFNPYLYANANPTVYYDPSGRIGILTKLSEGLAFQRNALAGQMDYTSGQVGDSALYQGLAIFQAVTSGVTNGLLGIAQGAVDAANFATNVVAVGLFDSEAAGEELAGTIAGLGKAYDAVVHDGKGGELVGQVARSVADTVGRAVKGDTRAMFDAVSTATELVAEGKVASTVAARLAKIDSAIARRASRASDIAEDAGASAARAAKHVDETAQALVAVERRTGGGAALSTEHRSLATVDAPPAARSTVDVRVRPNSQDGTTPSLRERALEKRRLASIARGPSADGPIPLPAHAPHRDPRTGREIAVEAGRTTAVIGSARDTMPFLDQLGVPPQRSLAEAIAANPGDLSMLNIIHDVWVRYGDAWWEDANAPWLLEAVRRNDLIHTLTVPDIRAPGVLWRHEGGRRVLTGFGREYLLLLKHGYTYDARTSRMVRWSEYASPLDGT